MTLPSLDLARPRSHPRLLVGLSLLSCACIYAAGFASGHPAAVLSLAGGLAWFPVYFLLRHHVQEAADLPDEQLDEREISLRDRSYLEAYRLLGGAIAVSLLVAIVDDAVDAAVVGSWLNPLAAILLLSAALPNIVMAVRTGGVVDE
jgi:hypothetical protein